MAWTDSGAGLHAFAGLDMSAAMGSEAMSTVFDTVAGVEACAEVSARLECQLGQTPQQSQRYQIDLDLLPDLQHLPALQSRLVLKPWQQSMCQQQL